MDYDLYFTILKQDLQDDDETSRERERVERANHGPGLEAGCLSIRIEEDLSEYISSLGLCRARIQVEENLNKPLPVSPEEPKASSKSMIGEHNAAYQQRRRDKSLPEPSRCLKATDESDNSPRQRHPRASKTRPVGIINKQTSTVQGAAVERPCPTRTDRNLSLWPKPHAYDIRKDRQTSAVTPQRHVDSSCNADLDSLHSEESCDVERWAREIYGPQDGLMTSLRDKRRVVSPRNASAEYSVDPVAMVNIHKASKAYADSAYCSSTSTGSYIDRDRTSSNSMSELLAEYAEQWRLQDLQATTFFDSDDDGNKSKRASENRPPANTLWRKMLRSAKGKLAGP